MSYFVLKKVQTNNGACALVDNFVIAPNRFNLFGYVSNDSELKISFKKTCRHLYFRFFYLHFFMFFTIF